MLSARQLTTWNTSVKCIKWSYIGTNCSKNSYRLKLHDCFYNKINARRTVFCLLEKKAGHTREPTNKCVWQKCSLRIFGIFDKELLKRYDRVACVGIKEKNENAKLQIRWNERKKSNRTSEQTNEQKNECRKRAPLFTYIRHMSSSAGRYYLNHK